MRTVSRVGAAVLLLSLALLAETRLTGAQDGVRVDVQPIVEWRLTDGSVRPERGGSWQLVGQPVRSGDDGERTAETSTHHVVLMVDTSASMPESHTGPGGFSAVVEEVTRRARDVLRPFAASRHIQVSLYRFDDLAKQDGRWAPSVAPVARDLTVAEALETLPELILRDPAAYMGQYTYIAASAFEAARRELAIPDDPSRRLPDDSDPLTFLVFTDVGERNGGENHNSQRAFDAAPYAAWLDRHVATNQLHYVHWDIRTSDVEALEPSQSVMSVQWAQPGRVDSWSRRTGPDALERMFDIYPIVRLVPALTAPDDPGRIVCAPREQVDAAPAPRELITLAWQRPLRYSIGDLSDVAVGRHDITLDEDTLCNGLTQDWPNVTFVLPARDGELTRLGWLEIVDPDIIVLDLIAKNTAADADLGTLRADRFHRWASVERTLQLASDDVEGLDVGVEWQVRARQNETWLAQADDLVRLVPDAEPAGTTDEDVALVTEDNTPVRLEVPGIHQRIFPFSRSVDQAPGAYTLEICAVPQIHSLPRPNARVALRCSGCADGAVREDRICPRPRVVLGGLPLSWWWIGTALIVAALAVGAIIRMATGPQFTQQTVGQPARLLSALVRGDLMKYLAWRWFRRPFLIRFSDQMGSKKVSGRHVGARLQRDDLYGTYIGVAPVGGGLKVWPVVVDRRMPIPGQEEASTADESWISVAGRRLTPAVDSYGRPIEHKRSSSRLIGKDKLVSGGVEICLHRVVDDEEQVQCIPVGWQGRARPVRPSTVPSIE